MDGNVMEQIIVSPIAKMFENMIIHSRTNNISDRMAVLFADEKISTEEYAYLKNMLNNRVASDNSNQEIMEKQHTDRSPHELESNS